MGPPAPGRFCLYCGRTNPSDYRFCEACHRQLPAYGHGGGRSRRRRRAILGIAIVAIVVVVILLAVGELVPVSSGFDLSVRSQGLAPSTVYHAFPANAPVRFHWSTDDGQAVTFTLVDGDGHALASSRGPSGNFSFRSQGGSYGFQSYSWFIEVVSVEGSYDAPWLAGAA